MYNVLLIDIDNTLLNFSKAEDIAINKTLVVFGVTPNEELVNNFKKINSELWKLFELKKITKERLLEKRFEDFFSLINKDIDSSKINKFYLNELSNCSALMPNALEMIREVCKSCKIYPVTNGVYNTQMKRINNSLLKDYFEDIFISETIGIQKPESGFFDFVFESINYPDKKKVLLVGDSLSADIIGGIRYGIDTCWYNPNNEESSLKPTYVIKDLMELIEIIEK